MTDQETLRRLASNLRYYRGDTSLAEIARRCETYPTAIKRIEDGESMPGLGLTTRLATALGITVDELLAPTSQRKALQHAS